MAKARSKKRGCVYRVMDAGKVLFKSTSFKAAQVEARKLSKTRGWVSVWQKCSTHESRAAHCDKGDCHRFIRQDRFMTRRGVQGVEETRPFIEQAVRMGKGPGARKMLRQRARTIRHEEIPELRDDARRLDRVAKGMRSERGQAGGRKAGGTIRERWGQVMDAARYGEVRDEALRDPESLTCFVRWLSRPGNKALDMATTGRPAVDARAVTFRRKLAAKSFDPHNFLEQAVEAFPDRFRSCETRVVTRARRSDDIPF